MILDSTTRSIEIVLGAAVATTQPKIVAHWVDMTASATTGGATTASANSTTAVTIVSAPAASTQRKVNNLTVYNGDTASVTATIRYNDNSTLYPIITITIPVGYTLGYTDAQGWYLLSPTGMLQQGVGTQPFAVQGINDQTGTSYTLVLTDQSKDVRCTNASAITLTVPPNSSVAFPIGAVLLFSQGGAGAVAATAGAGVTLHAANGSATTALYDIRGLEKIDTNTWRVV